jgi:hypothetical protein
MNLSLINFNLLNGDLMYRMMEPLKRKGIRWLALNGGIRWVSLNEREKAVNERGGKEDKRREKHSRRDFWIFGGEHHFERRGLYCWFGAGVACWRMVLVFA